MTTQLPHRQDRIPILGDYATFRRRGFEFWTEAGRLGPVAEVRFGSQVFWVVTDPAIAEHVLLTHVKDYPRDRRLMALNRGPGPELMFNTDRWDEWRWRRRTLTPAFHRRTIASFGERFVAHSIAAAESWLDAGRIDLQARMRDLTMGIILDTMFSVTDAGDVRELQHSFETASDVVAARASAPVPVPWWLPTPANIELGKLTRYRWRYLAGLISRRVAEGPGSDDLLDLLIAERADDDGAGFGEADLVGEMSGIVFAGHETTAETQSWVLAELTAHPDVEARLLDEIDTVLGDREATIHDLERMPYTDRVIQEAMRLHPAVYLTIREADVEHRVGDLTIPVGTRLVINIRGLHMDPSAWDQPDRFDPDRFEADGGRHRFQFIPFLAGPKKCLGDSFAMTEMRLVLPTLLRRLRVRPTAGMPTEVGGFTLAMDGGFPVVVEKR